MTIHLANMVLDNWFEKGLNNDKLLRQRNKVLFIFITDFFNEVMRSLFDFNINLTNI